MSEASKGSERMWRRLQETTISNCTYQSEHERFRKGAIEPPEHAHWSMNLTALSQRYNLYFAAYEDVIHITIPKDLKQTLEPIPALKIQLPRSSKGIEVGGYVYPNRPHSVNHLVIGNLGHYEILLMACDDGDVIAYYTHLLAEEVDQCRAIKKGIYAATHPFFHENVGKSAWGLAIHEKSRLIAVSCNLHQVTVFVFAIDGPIDDLPTVHLSSGMPEQFPRIDKPEIYKDRVQCFRIIFVFGDQATNFPSIDFHSDQDGEAQGIAAMDIRCCFWYLSIWERTDKNPHFICHDEKFRTYNMGWGVLALSLRDFRPEPTPHEALGMNCLSSRSVYEESHLPWYRLMTTTENPGTEDKTDDADIGNELTTLMEMETRTLRHFIDNRFEFSNWHSMPTSKTKLGEAVLEHEEAASIETIAYLHTYSFGLCLFQNEKHHPDTYFPYLMDKQHNWEEPGYIRLCMLAKIPELSLVVVAEQSGNVALLTLTRLAEGFSRWGPVLMLRRDHILRARDQVRQTLDRPLLGIAVSPMPSSEGFIAKKNVRPRRWRLLLTYFDSSIMSYEISREVNDELWVV